FRHIILIKTHFALGIAVCGDKKYHIRRVIKRLQPPENFIEHFFIILNYKMSILRTADKKNFLTCLPAGRNPNGSAAPMESERERVEEKSFCPLFAV
ncbi:MAG: hypothetical protein AAB514_02250, partial [Patescibacteria group bacterium]